MITKTEVVFYNMKDLADFIERMQFYYNYSLHVETVTTGKADEFKYIVTV